MSLFNITLTSQILLYQLFVLQLNLRLTFKHITIFTGPLPP
jgi:hypothetical protein